jgi:hypothetical protein
VAKLSPAAQSVLDAYISAPCGKPRSVWINWVAAALRAAADQLVVTDGECPGVTLWEKGFRAGAGGAHDALLAIAAELEATTP